jgi:Family of unknown function (DUF5675)
MLLYLHRFCYDDLTGTFGKLFTDKGTFLCYTIEELWNNNEKFISCIPTGTYELRPRHSEKHGEHLIVQEVPNRDYILFHAGNHIVYTEGCILPNMGIVFGQFGKARQAAGVQSKVALRKILEAVAPALRREEKIYLTILNEPMPL